MTEAPNHWLMKSEPGSYSIDDLARAGRDCWEGVRNFQARNHMRAMQLGDLVLFYHSSVRPPGVAGVAKVVATAYPDPTQFETDSPYYDKRASKKRPLWDMVDVAFVQRFGQLIPLSQLRDDPALDGMLVTKRGMRLSVQPVEPSHFARILELANNPTLATGLSRH